MPIYEYRCRRCGKQFELIRAFSEADNVICLKCGEPAQRLPSASASFIFKDGANNQGITSLKHRESCNRTSPCCGAETPCDEPPCES